MTTRIAFFNLSASALLGSVISSAVLSSAVLSNVVFSNTVNASELTLTDSQIKALDIQFVTLNNSRRHNITLTSLPAIATVPDNKAQIISLPFEGRVEAWQARAGDALKREQPLADLHSHDVLNFFQRNRRQQQESALCDQRLSDMRERSKRGLTSKLDLQEQNLKCQMLRDELTLNKQILMHLPASWENNLSAEFHFNAARDGWLNAIMRKPGDHFTAGEALAVFWPRQELRLKVMLPASLSSTLKQGDTLMVRDQSSGERFNASVESISHTENAAHQQTLWLTSVTTNPADIKPGSVLQADIPSAEDGWAVAPSSRIRSDSQSWIFVRSEQGVTPVKLERFIAGNQQLLLQDSELENAEIAVTSTATLKSLWQSGEEE
tara:strand:- start:41864 stop:43003 length:1140 start_codon:yes stop_codon:yes gene_type:complete